MRILLPADLDRLLLTVPDVRSPFVTRFRSLAAGTERAAAGDDIDAAGRAGFDYRGPITSSA
jgi:hypothetical protein